MNQADDHLNKKTDIMKQTSEERKYFLNLGGHYWQIVQSDLPTENTKRHVSNWGNVKIVLEQLSFYI